MESLRPCTCSLKFSEHYWVGTGVIVTVSEALARFVENGHFFCWNVIDDSVMLGLVHLVEIDLPIRPYYLLLLS